jgi:hypothetical protein
MQDIHCSVGNSGDANPADQLGRLGTSPASYSNVQNHYMVTCHPD